MLKLALLALLFHVSTIAQSVEIQDMELRLQSPIASYSRPGTAFTARVIGPAKHDAPAVLPANTIVRGKVSRAHSIGLGLRHERAGLTLEFVGCELPGGQPADCDIRLLAIDNARETVHRNNRIQGMLVASHPPSLLNGLWYKPGSNLLLRPVSGLVGAGGMLCHRLVPGPVSAAIFIASRLIFFRMPEPDIELPAGTDLIARVFTSHARSEDPPPALAASEPLPEGLSRWFAGLPSTVTRPGGAPMPDPINMAFLSTESEIAASFEAAGWHGADVLKPRTFARTFGKTYSAFRQMKGYARAPVSMIHYEGRPPDLVFQKSFNTLSQRHHIRLWRQDWPGSDSPVWVGAATHDVGVAVNWNRMSPTHRIDPHVDRERSKVANDLTAAGCLLGFQRVQREPSPILRRPQLNKVVTDGDLWATRLQACQTAKPAPALALSRPKHSRVLLSLRRTVLETRYYLTRANAYNFGFQTVRWAFFGRNKGNPEDGMYSAALRK